MIRVCRCLQGQCERNEKVRSLFFALLPVLIFGSVFAIIEWQLDLRAWALAHAPYGWLVLGGAVLLLVLVIALVMWIACHHHPTKPAETYFRRRDTHPGATRWVEKLGQKQRGKTPLHSE